MADIFNNTPSDFVNMNNLFTVLNDRVGLTSTQWLKLVENTNYLLNHLGLADVDVGSVETQFTSPGTFSDVIVTHREEEVDGTIVDYFDYLFKIPTPNITTEMTTTRVENDTQAGMEITQTPIYQTINGDEVITGYHFSFTAKIPVITKIIMAYIVDGVDEFSSGWLSDIDGGDAFEPSVSYLYIIKTSGDYYLQQYIWDGISSYKLISNISDSERSYWNDKVDREYSSDYSYTAGLVFTFDTDHYIIGDDTTTEGNGYTGSDSTITIPKYYDDGTNGVAEVTEIGQYAFKANSTITSINIPDSVTSIGNSSFSNCTNLTSINIPNSVTSIGTGAFSLCTSLTNISIPNGVSNIGDYAFNYCTSLKFIEIPDSLTSINSDMFSYCYGLIDIKIPKTITSIGDFVFMNCTSLTNISIPNSVTSIGVSIFKDCSNLTSVTIYTETPQTLTDDIFYNSGITKINVPYDSLVAYKSATNWSGYANIIYPISEGEWIQNDYLLKTNHLPVGTVEINKAVKISKILHVGDDKIFPDTGVSDKFSINWSVFPEPNSQVAKKYVNVNIDDSYFEVAVDEAFVGDKTFKITPQEITIDGERILDETDINTIDLSYTASTGILGIELKNQAGTTISSDSVDLPLETIIESGTIETCTVDDEPVVGYVVGDKYLDLVLANESHIYVLVTDFVDQITITETGTGNAVTDISINGSVITETKGKTFVETSRTVAGKELSSDITLASSDLTDSANLIKGATIYGGTISDNFDTITKDGFYTGYGTATGAPNTTYSWFLLHENSNTGVISAKQTATAYNSSDIIIFVRVKMGSTWGAWVQLEMQSNKVTSISSSSTDTQYASAKCVYDIVGDIETLLGGI